MSPVLWMTLSAELALIPRPKKKKSHCSTYNSAVTYSGVLPELLELSRHPDLLNMVLGIHIKSVQCASPKHLALGQRWKHTYTVPMSEQSADSQIGLAIKPSDYCLKAPCKYCTPLLITECQTVLQTEVHNQTQFQNLSLYGEKSAHYIFIVILERLKN